ncbi:MAG TPA: LURP-one-related family protein [Ktedonobacteraceae bacterium]|nr:LURP-one-related family protein [Ktedonobacteraceae bacterium]
MRYHIKERAWSLTEAFVVRDQAGNAVFEIRGKFFHIGDNLEMFDIGTGQELVQIKQRVISLMPHYEIDRIGMFSASMHEQFHFFGEKFKIQASDGTDFHVQGDIWNWDFSLSDGSGNLLAQIGRQFSLFRDSYAVDVAQGVDAPFVIALAIVIDMIREHHEQRR